MDTIDHLQLAGESALLQAQKHLDQPGDIAVGSQPHVVIIGAGFGEPETGHERNSSGRLKHAGAAPAVRPSGRRHCVSVCYALCSSAFMSLMVEENARGGTAAPSP